MVATSAAVSIIANRVKGALWGIFIADALSMPVHWYYDVSALHRDYGQIAGYMAPKDFHPGSIMSLSNTGGHGRGGQEGRIIGEVINHGKHKYWAVPNTHYHRGMSKGENTLNALCARVVMRGIAADGGAYSRERFLSDYIQFMTTPGSHNDTYAESYHRDFFKRWTQGVPPQECSKGTEGHNTASIGGFVTMPPVLISAMFRGSTSSGKSMSRNRDISYKKALSVAKEHLSLTHDSRRLGEAAEIYGGLLADVLMGEDLREAVARLSRDRKLGWDIESLARSSRRDEQVIGSVIGSACYIEQSLPAVAYFASRYADSFEQAVLANTNSGGENCHRGSALGALMGAAVGEAGIPGHLKTGLHAYPELRAEIDAFVQAILLPDPVAHSGSAPAKELR